MAKLDYTKDLGVPSHVKTVPRPIAYAILAVVGVAASFGVAGVMASSDAYHRKERAASAKPAPAPAASAVPAPAK